MLPAAGGGDDLSPPHAGGSVEVEEDAGAAAAAVLEDEVAVEQDGLDLGEEAVVAVHVGPAGLDHADGGLGEVVDDLHEPVARGDEVGVEDGDELAASGAEAGVEGSGLVAVAVFAVEVVDGLGGEAPVAGGVALDDVSGYGGGLVGGVVEDLDFEAVAGVVEAAAGVDEAADDELLVEDGELDGDEGKFALGEAGYGLVPAGGVLLVAEVEPDELVAVEAEEGQDDHDEEVGDEEGVVEGGELVEVLEGAVGVVGLQVVAEAVGGGEEPDERGLKWG